MKTFVWYCVTFAFFPILIPTIIGWVKYRYARNAEKYIIALMTFCLIMQLVTMGLWQFEINNLWVSHVLTPIELFLLLMYYQGEFSGVFSQVLVLMGGSFGMFVVVDVLFFHSPFEMNATAKSIECVLLVLVSLIVWVKIMKDMELKKLTSAPIFWINSAVLMYFSTTILLFRFSRLILELPELATWIWNLHLIFMTLYYVLFSIGLWKIKRTKHL